MNVVFIARGGVEWASSRMRCYWVADAMSDHAVVETWDDVQSKKSITEGDAYVFQKSLDPVMAAHLRERGALVVWDVCDPSWWWEPRECAQFLQHIDGVTCSNQALANDFRAWTGGKIKTVTIPDRLDLAHFPMRAKHGPRDSIRLVWFGVAVNRSALLNAWTNLERLQANGYKIEFTILDNRDGDPFLPGPLPFSLTHKSWTLETENAELASHDLAILPPFPGAWGTVKSNNKKITAWACGLAVSAGTDYADLERLVKSHADRKTQADNGLLLVREKYNVRQSAIELQEALKWMRG